MFKISPQQYATWLQRQPAEFVREILDHVTHTMPEEVRGIPPHLVAAMIETGIERARGHGLSTDEDIVAFVGVMFEIAPNFDDEPTLRAVLAEKTLTPAQRWQALFAGTPSLATAWERAAAPQFYDAAAWIK